MNMAVNEAANLGSAIRDAASASKSVLVEATVQTRDDGSTPMVILSSEDAVWLISAHAPRVIYLVEQSFDLADELETALEELDDIGVEHSPDHLKATQRQFAKYDGQIGATIASFMIDGVLHTAVCYRRLGTTSSATPSRLFLKSAREGASAGQISKHSEEGEGDRTQGVGPGKAPILQPWTRLVRQTHGAGRNTLSGLRPPHAFRNYAAGGEPVLAGTIWRQT
jgi:hypothetical protein